MKTFVCLLFIHISFRVFSQEIPSADYNQTPLKEVLTDLEEKTNLLFSYSEEAVKGKTITLMKASISVAQLLSELSSQTGLKFEKITDTQIIISIPTPKFDVCGYLYNAETKEALPFANVIVKGIPKGTITNEDGFFQISIEQQAILIIQYVGFSNMIVNAAQLITEDCSNLFLQPQAQSLQEIVVIGYLTQGVDKNTDGSNTIKNEELGILPGLVEPDVFNCLQLIPGITSLNESASDIQIRGGSQDQNLIYFDGIKMYNTGHFFGMISEINPYVVKSTKIYKGGASPEYGDRVSGVIDISCDKRVPIKTSGGLGVNGTHGDAFLKTHFGKNVGLVVSARRSYTDLLKTPTYNALSEKVFQNTKIASNSSGQVIDQDDDFTENLGKEAFFFYDGSAKLIIQPSKSDNLAISGLITNNDLDFSVRDDEDLITDKLVVKKHGASFSWQGTRFEKIHHSLKGYYSSFDSDFKNQVTEDLLLEVENVRKNTVEDYGLDVNLAYDFTNVHTLRTGYQYSHVDVFFQLFRDEANADDNEIDPEDKGFNIKRKGVNQANAVYAEYLFKPKNKVFVSLGIRASHYSSVDNFFFEPRLNVEYPLSNVFRLKATAEIRSQPISQFVEFEDTQLRLENHIWVLSDGLEIPILISKQFSGGLLISAGSWIIDIDGYFKKIEGLTSFTNGFTNVAEEISEGENSIVGIDFLVRKKIGDFRIWLGYTFNDVEYTFPQLQNDPFRGNNDITHNFRISNTYELKEWEFSLGWMYRTGSPYTPAEGFNTSTGQVDFGPINSLRLPDYHRLDASILYEVFSSNSNSNFRGMFGISLQNIYFKQIPLSVSYRVDLNPDTEQNELDQVQQLSLGFTPNATIRLYF